MGTGGDDFKDKGLEQHGAQGAAARENRTLSDPREMLKFFKSDAGKGQLQGDNLTLGAIDLIAKADDLTPVNYAARIISGAIMKPGDIADQSSDWSRITHNAKGHTQAERDNNSLKPVFSADHKDAYLYYMNGHNVPTCEHLHLNENQFGEGQWVHADTKTAGTLDDGAELLLKARFDPQNNRYLDATISVMRLGPNGTPVEGYTKVDMPTDQINTVLNDIDQIEKHTKKAAG